MAAALVRIPSRTQSFFCQKSVFLHRKIHTWVWWDVENCAIPDGCEHSIAANIRNAVANLNYDGPVSIAAYHRGLTLRIHQALTDTGVSSINVCSGGGSGVVSANLLYDMFCWALDNPPPANCLVISNDGGLSYGLHDLGKSYNILLARHGRVRPHLESAAKTVWRWTSLRAGGPPQKTTVDISMV